MFNGVTFAAASYAFDSATSCYATRAAQQAVANGQRQPCARVSAVRDA